MCLSISKEQDTCLERSYSRDDLLTQFTSDDREKLNETQKLKICGGGLNAGWSPSHPPSKKAAIPDRTWEGFEENSLRVAL